MSQDTVAAIEKLAEVVGLTDTAGVEASLDHINETLLIICDKLGNISRELEAIGSEIQGK